MVKTLQNIAVIGGGAWGTALAEVFAQNGRTVMLYARDAGLADILNKTRENKTYLPGVKLSPSLHATADMADLQTADIFLLATPAQFLRGTLKNLAPHMSKNIPLINAAKGIEMETGKLLSEVAAEEAPAHPYAALSGPSFAAEVARGLPTALTLATSACIGDAQIWAKTLSGKAFRPYLSHDPVGVDIAGAVKNVIAIAAGIVEGKQLGLNARAAVMTRGMAEIKRLGLKKGAQADTFLGLAGIGDLCLTCNSMTSRNFSLGHDIGQGKRLEDILKSRKTVAEGVATAKAVCTLAKELNVDMPIILAVNSILHEGAKVEDVVKDLLSRDLKKEDA